MNLIDNALDAAPDHGHIAVSASQEADRLVVRIVDDGPGIPAEIQQKIFDPFFTTKGVGKGTGLGLDIVRRLLAQHEGNIALESAPGRTEFQVRLPVER
jgi:signal transduction histidine kinase